MGASTLFKEIQGVASFLKGETNRNPYPDSKGITTILKENWIKKLPYGFRVVNQEDSKKFNSSSGGGVRTDLYNRQFAPFNLTINPESLQQDEIFAINITPTQGGVVSEHNGIVFKDIQLSGTTGIHPRRGTTGANAKGDILFGDSGLMSGYEEFLHLRNYFRAYAEEKRKGNTGLLLIFVNRKDNESLVVEPIKFTMKRSASKATLYEYNIALKVISNFVTKPDPLDLLDDFENILESVQDTVSLARAGLLKFSSIIRGIESSIDSVFGVIRQLDLALTTLKGLPLQVGHMSNNLVNRFNQSATFQLLGVARNQKNNARKFGSFEFEDFNINENIEKASKLGGLAILGLGGYALVRLALDKKLLSQDMIKDFDKDTSDALGLTISNLVDLKTKLTRIETTLTGSFNIGDKDYDKLIGAVTPIIDNTKQTTNEEIEILAYLRRLIGALNDLISTGRPLTQPNENKILQDKNINFDLNLNYNLGASVKEVVIPYQASMESLAITYLGDINRWIDIVEINNLRFPFIVESNVAKNPFLKSPGEKIYIPSSSPSIQTLETPSINRINKNATNTEKSMGVDLKLNDNFDLVMGTDNDFVLVSSASNLKQALRLKLNMDRGELVYHPTIGVGIIVGEKNTSPLAIATEIEDVIKQDPRVGKINSLGIYIEGNAVTVKTTISASESSDSVQLNINI